MVISATLLGIAASLGASSTPRVEVQATATVRILAGEHVHFGDHPRSPEDRDEHGPRHVRHTNLVIDGTAVPAALFEFE